MKRNDIEQILIENILIGRLEIERSELEMVDKEISIFDDEGLDLDSVEALDIVAGLEQEFNITIDELHHDLMTDILFNIDSIVEYIDQRLND